MHQRRFSPQGLAIIFDNAHIRYVMRAVQVYIKDYYLNIHGVSLATLRGANTSPPIDHGYLRWEIRREFELLE